MKKIFIIAAIAGMFSGCKPTQVTSVTDDVYANPTEERKLAQAAAEEKARQEARERRIREEAMAAEKEKEESKPVYKDPVYNADDYYDYEYAARINRFHNPVYGAGFYDPYYTNLYTYNRNPAFWGTSIYSSSLWMPSNSFNNFSFGFSTGYGYNNFYDPYGYSGFNPWYRNYGPWGYDPYGYNAWGYNSGFMNGYNMGYYNGWNNSQWGYLNRYDPNSGYSKMEYAPRGSNVGGNGQQRSTPGMERPSEQYFKTVAEEQNRAQRFNASDNRINNRISNKGQRPGGGSVLENDQNQGQMQQRNDGARPNTGNSGTQRDNNRVRKSNNNQQPQQQQNQNTSNDSWNPTPAPVSPGNSNDGGSRPRNSSGGGNSRPR